MKRSTTQANTNDSLVNFEASTVFLEDKINMMTIDITKLRERPDFSLIRFADAHYLGDLVKNVRHGLGVMIYKSGRRYEGWWSKDKRHGN